MDNIDFKKHFVPLLKMVDQLDKEAILALLGVFLLCALFIGGLEDAIMLIIGFAAGIAFFKKFLN